MSEPIHFIGEAANYDDANSALWSNHIQQFSPDQVMDMLLQLEHMWKLTEKNDKYMSYHVGYLNFFTKDELSDDGLPISIDLEKISAKHMRMHDRLCELYHRADTLGIMDLEDDDDMKTSVRINRLIDQVEDAWQIVFRNARISDRVNNPTYVPINPESDPSIFRTSTMKNIEELIPYQQACLTVLKDLYEREIKRYKGHCCKQIMTKDGASTRAWKVVETIQDYVYGVGKKERMFELWKNLTMRPSTHNDVIRHLTNTKDMQFQDIKKDRHVWSFTNGIFIGKEFDPEHSSEENTMYRASFYTYDSPEFKALDQTVVSCKYFEQDFPDYSAVDWRDIPTPHFDSVLTYQGFDKDVREWVCVLGGRLCFDVNEIDKWQCIPFLKGVAQSGKSTLITKVFRKFYNTEDVRTLSNNVERKFGLSSIYDAFLFIAPEIKGDLALEQAEFQSIVSGEDVSIAVKHEKAKSIEWKTPGILGGNEVPGWRDNSGSILRRVLTLDFTKKVKEADPTLDQKLEKELPIILQKCVRAYLEIAQRYRDETIWSIVPPYFERVKQQIESACSPLLSFLNSAQVEIDPKKKCPLPFFKEVFSAYCMKEGKSRAINADIWAGPFGERNITVEVLPPTKYTRFGPGYPDPKEKTESKNISWVLGLDIVDTTPVDVETETDVGDEKVSTYSDSCTNTGEI